MTSQSAAAALALAPLLLLAACGDSDPTDPASGAFAAASAKKLDLAACDPGQGGFATTSTNPWFPFAEGNTWSYEGDDDGEFVELQITVLAQLEVVAGVTTRVIEERESVDGQLVELSLNYVAQAPDGTVCYFGEAVDIFEPGEPVSHEGAWRADEPGNGPGIIMPADPRPGVSFQMEDAPGIAEDEGTIVGGNTEVELANGEEYGGVIRVRESNPLDGGKGYKLYSAGTGLIVDEGVELLEFTP
jgi:hypothetical protein